MNASISASVAPVRETDPSPVHLHHAAAAASAAAMSRPCRSFVHLRLAGVGQELDNLPLPMISGVGAGDDPRQFTFVGHRAPRDPPGARWRSIRPTLESEYAGGVVRRGCDRFLRGQSVLRQASTIAMGIDGHGADPDEVGRQGDRGSRIDQIPPAA